MTHLSSKGKLLMKRKEVSRKAEWDKALMELRKLRRSGNRADPVDARLIVQDGLVIVQVKPTERAKKLYVKNLPSTVVSEDRYRAQLEAYNRQVRQHFENSRADSDRIIRTLKESPSQEALAFYDSISRR